MLPLDILNASTDLQATLRTPQVPIDLIVTDIEVPRPDGLELIDIVRNEMHWPHLLGDQIPMDAPYFISL